MDESEIPIDIHTSKLMDWLVSRRHVPRDWQSKVLIIREKINEAITDMPVDERITALLSGSYINYYHCQQIVEILKQTEASSKNFLGQYSSKRMKDWLEIIKLYEKDNIYLGEVASLLLRNVNYEVPALRKQIQRTIHLQKEYDKKDAEYEKLANAFKNEFNASCKSLGINGKKIREELVAKAGDFPLMNEKLAKEMTILKPAIEFYTKAVHILLSKDKTVLPLLNYIIEKGDTTVYEWKYKKPPSSIEPNKLLLAVEENPTDDDTIDFGTDIDFEGEEENIDWGISTEDSEITSNEESKNDDVARGGEALTILGNPNMRKSLTNDVLELEAFLKIRIHEMSSQSDGLTLSMLPDALQIYDEKSVRGLIQNVQIILGEINNPNSLHYLNITTNARYVDQLAEKLKHKLASYEKMLASREFVKNQKQEAIKEGTALQPKVDVLIEKSKELQDSIEKDISKRYNGRPVNLIAGAYIL